MVFTVKLTGPCNTHQARKHPAHSLPGVQDIHTPGPAIPEKNQLKFVLKPVGTQKVYVCGMLHRCMLHRYGFIQLVLTIPP